MKHTACSGAVAFALSLAQTALAAQAPDAGQILENIKAPLTLPPATDGVLPEAAPARPALSLPSDVKLQIKAFRITGAREFSEAHLLALLADSTDRELSLAQLQGLAERITAHYREQGYLLARAYLPAQDIKGGLLTIAVLEGRLGKVRLDNRSLLNDATAQRQLDDLHPGDAVQAAALERSLLLLNELPGAEVHSTLKPGASVGLTDLDVSLGAGPRVAGSLEADNFDNRYTGSERLGGNLAINSPTGLGDSLSLRGLTSGAGMNYGRLAYQLPLGPQATQVGLAWSEMRYELGEDFASLDAHGKASIASVYALQPLLRSRQARLDGQLSYERKRLEDRVDATDTTLDKTLDVWSLGLSGSHQDSLLGGGAMQYGASLVAGNLELDAASDALDDAGLDTRGHYAKLAFQLTRLQRLTDRFSLQLRASGQRAAKNLDSSEKLSLGGAYAVRAYPQGEAAADDAWLANLELRYALAPAWQLFGFYDAGGGRISHRPVAGTADNRRTLSGAGVGVSLALPAAINLQAFAAWRTGSQPTSDDDRSPRLWLQTTKYF
ncbi:MULTISPECIES: ShlB/FhaC/HecB family hemolysin secretion/activation protein [unclassified Pseudomonas]|uniref:ShlB/FhaC/HecB family hemolysin secretion/activation protein n=1 Tax=unclassified Pseudomonas TaxID=196821 RepID=UPI000DA9FF4C|nr:MULTISPECIES: ShlB/FhaC/HecB family hemolysin secretion/activation protein [unclassified Pseudomonas]MDW3715484.1 ShlB/FhaC/HecB family hemolysin secretion/activation protein [Pseudomonas sp. 2023EL-01195]PZE12153.1 ShlB/FhaC/HecB family hemolysin secretion/activation protein [Pseudomonas sp. 57B-090624]